MVLSLANFSTVTGKLAIVQYARRIERKVAYVLIRRRIRACMTAWKRTLGTSYLQLEFFVRLQQFVISSSAWCYEIVSIVSDIGTRSQLATKIVRDSLSEMRVESGLSYLPAQ